MDAIRLSRLARQALQRQTGDLVFDMGAEDFLRHYFEKQPIAAGKKPAVDLDWPEFFAALPRLHQQGEIRYLTPKSPALGLDRAEVEAALRDLGGLTRSAFEKYFHGNSVTFAVQQGNRAWPAIGRAVEGLAELLRTRVSPTVIATPPHSSGTSIHYDSSDVFGVQLQGKKRWWVFEPEDELPCLRTPVRKVSQDPAELQAYECYDLGGDDALYVPRGWIHDVENIGSEASLHVSFVAHPNTWLSLFSNLLDQGLDQLRERPQWREAIARVDADSEDAGAVLADFVSELQEEMTARLHRHGWANFDHVLNDPRNSSLRARAMESIHEVGEGRGLILQPSGAHYLIRHSDIGDLVRLSGDGRRYYDIPAPIYHRLAGRQRVALEDLEQVAASEEQLVNVLYALVHETGAYQLIRATEPRLRMRQDFEE